MTHSPLSRQKKSEKFGYFFNKSGKVMVLKSWMTVRLSAEYFCHFDFEFLVFFSNNCIDLFHLFALAFMLSQNLSEVNCP